MEDTTGAKFNTRLLHGKTATGYGQREILPPISQVTAFQYESMEELERVFRHKSMGYAYTRINDGEPIRNVPRSVKEEGHLVLRIDDNGDGTFELFIKKIGD